MLRIGLIYNKYSGRKFRSKKINQVREILLRHGTVQEYEIKNPKELTKEYDDLTTNFDLLVLAGGDGTVNGVLNVLKSKTPNLLVLPFGSGNDISNCCHPKLKVKKIDRALHEYKFNEMDVLEILETISSYCLTVACLGTDARVSKTAAVLPRFFAGTRYVIATFIEIAKNKSNSLTVETDDFSFKGEVSICSLANTPQYGGGIKISPSSKINDSKLELIFVKRLGRWSLLVLFALLLFKQHTKSKRIQFISATQIKVQPTSEAVEIWADGQFMGSLPAVLKLADFKIRTLRV